MSLTKILMWFWESVTDVTFTFWWCLKTGKKATDDKNAFGTEQSKGFDCSSCDLLIAELHASDVYLLGSRGEVSPVFFWKSKKSVPILKKGALFVWIYELISHLNFNFKSILRQQKKQQNFPCGALLFVCRTWNVYRSAHIQETSPV